MVFLNISKKEIYSLNIMAELKSGVKENKENKNAKKDRFDYFKELFYTELKNIL